MGIVGVRIAKGRSKISGQIINLIVTEIEPLQIRQSFHTKGNGFELIAIGIDVGERIAVDD